MQKLGQHFLRDKGILKKIAEALEIKDGDSVVEIGPGHGELTEFLIKELAAYNAKLLLVEKDRELIPFLRKKFESENVLVLEGDILKALPQLVSDYKLQTVNPDAIYQNSPEGSGLRPGRRNFKLVGNIPYYISGYLFRILSELKSKPSIGVFTIQNEVADRINAKPPKMNLLAASVQIWAETKIISRVKSSAFIPPPKVQSAVIKFTTKTSSISEDNLESYYKFLHILFKQPRKTILNNLSDGLDIDKIEVTSRLSIHNLDYKKRPQNLNLDEIIKLFNLICA